MSSSNSDTTKEEESPLLLLPPPPSKDTSNSESESITRIEVDGATVSLVDALGPTVVNHDGTLSRIANWPDMTLQERERIIRVLGKRNKLRLSQAQTKVA